MKFIFDEESKLISKIGLEAIHRSVQDYSDAMAAALEMEITTVDHRFIRIAGTGRFKERIKESVPKGSIFEKSILDCKSFLIEDPGKNPACQDCEKKNNCLEVAEACVPIMLNNRAVGVIGIIAFNDQQRKLFAKKKQSYFDFLSKMAKLIAAELQRERIDKKLVFMEGRWDVAVDSLKEGIITTNTNGYVLQINQAALNLLKLREKETLNQRIDNLILDDSIRCIRSDKSPVKLKDKYITFVRKNQRLHFLLSINPIISEANILGAIVVLKDFQDIEKSVVRTTLVSEKISFDMILGQSRIMQETVELARKVSLNDATILITGESGTGKELFARAIHTNSTRKDAPFVAINCAAIPETLFESEVFGYEEGAFTGSKRGGKIGKIEIAHEGTLFLDEIGDMPQYMQTKLLRVLQDGQLFKVGGVTPISVNIRIIAATNRNLEKMVDEGNFRRDLFYRLNVIPIYISPLREHMEDLELLIYEFFNKYCRRHNKEIFSIEQKLIDYLRNYRWPGNIRELENIIEYGVCLETTPVLRKETILPRINLGTGRQGGNIVEPLSDTISRLETKIIRETLHAFGNDSNAVEKTLKALKISRATLYRKLK